MKNLVPLMILVFLLTLSAWSAVTPEKILPINTFAVVTVPDLNAARKLFKADPLSLMWSDPSMAAFTGKIEKAFRENVMDRIREEASVDPAEIWNLAQRQVTIALTHQPDQSSPGVILLVDSGKKIAELDRGMLLLRETLADNQVEHERLQIEATDFLRMPLPGRNEAAFYLGQSKSMFIITNSEQLAETLVKNHKNPKANAVLKDNPAFAIQHKAQFAGAWMYGWLDFSTVLEVVNHEIEKRRDPAAEPNPLMPEPKRVMEALGLTGLKDVGISGRTDDGMLFEINLNVPEVARRGLFSMIAPKNKDAGPPPFVPSDVVSFGRLRQSAAHIWKTFVETANEITPAAAGAMAFFQAQIQTKNPDFKLKAQLIDTMGDDFIMIEMAPRGLGLKDIINSPRLYLINSKKPKVTLRALMDIISMVIDAPPEEEEIEGRTLYSYNFGNFIDINRNSHTYKIIFAFI